ncbi:hypothetical protein PV11_03103 [Exophiala sideris]|uniref:Methyltransferase domain-containing protein n=1 Tax=Exophiala sideris TaxID=1016849 RepID=A0A0D1XHB8_9EURO|nr:hypothetical protein PV11_03103 [Exophiala sideris]
MASKGLTTQTNASNHIALINECMTGPPAEAILKKCGLLDPRPDSAAPLYLLDNASGIGTLIFRLLKHNSNISFRRIVGADIDENYLSFLRERAAKKGVPSVEALRLDQQAPELDSASFEFIFNNFGVFFAPKDTAVLTETHRMLRSGGFAGFTSWAKLAWWDELLLPALDRYVAGAPALPDPTKLFPATGWMDPQTARAKLQDAGFVEVHSEIWSFTPEVSAEDLALACTHLVKAVSARAWDESARLRFEPLIEDAFRRYLYDSFEGGRWTGKMSAVLTWGRKA